MANWEQHTGSTFMMRCKVIEILSSNPTSHQPFTTSPFYLYANKFF